MPKKYTFKITPQTNVRSTQGDRIYFRIQRDKLRPEGLKRLMRLERYNKYKIDLLALAKAMRFEPGLNATLDTWSEYACERIDCWLVIGSHTRTVPSVTWRACH